MALFLINKLDRFFPFLKIFIKALDKFFLLYYNIKVAGVAQSVVQLIRNQQVVCSSHITSSRKKLVLKNGLFSTKSAIVDEIALR